MTTPKNNHLDTFRTGKGSGHDLYLHENDSPKLKNDLDPLRSNKRSHTFSLDNCTSTSNDTAQDVMKENEELKRLLKIFSSGYKNSQNQLEKIKRERDTLKNQVVHLQKKHDLASRDSLDPDEASELIKDIRSKLARKVQDIQAERQTYILREKTLANERNEWKMKAEDLEAKTNEMKRRNDQLSQSCADITAHRVKCEARALEMQRKLDVSKLRNEELSKAFKVKEMEFMELINSTTEEMSKLTQQKNKEIMELVSHVQVYAQMVSSEKFKMKGNLIALKNDDKKKLAHSGKTRLATEGTGCESGATGENDCINYEKNDTKVSLRRVWSPGRRLKDPSGYGGHSVSEQSSSGISAENLLKGDSESARSKNHEHPAVMKQRNETSADLKSKLGSTKDVARIKSRMDDSFAPGEKVELKANNNEGGVATSNFRGDLTGEVQVQFHNSCESNEATLTLSSTLSANYQEHRQRLRNATYSSSLAPTSRVMHQSDRKRSSVRQVSTAHAA